MVGEFTYSRTEQQLKQLALTQAHNLLEYEIWGHIDILVVAARRLSRRRKVKTLLAGPSTTNPILVYESQSGYVHISTSR